MTCLKNFFKSYYLILLPVFSHFALPCLPHTNTQVIKQDLLEGRVKLKGFTRLRALVSAHAFLIKRKQLRLNTVIIKTREIPEGCLISMCCSFLFSISLISLLCDLLQQSRLLRSKYETFCFLKTDSDWSLASSSYLLALFINVRGFT